MIFKQLSIGGDRNFAYLIGHPQTREAAVVDPGYNPVMILTEIESANLELKYIINTHNHYDHTGGNQLLLERTNAVLVGYNPPEGMRVSDGDTLALGSIELKIIHTPGHTPESICILAGNKLITGDTLFVGKVGGTGFGDDARQEYHSLHEKLMVLPPDTEVYPGHDVGEAPMSTISNEKETNPFVFQSSFEDFVDLKKNWADYKLKHGIK